MAFDRLANALTKHYKLVIVLWIVALLAAVPAIMQVDKAVQYQSDFGTGDGYESMQAQKVINENFQTSVANGSVIVVLQSDNMTSPEARDFVLALENKIQTSPDIKYLQGTSSLYSISQSTLDQYIMQLGPAMRPAEQNVSMSAFLLWGIPATHAANYASTGSDAESYANTSAFLTGYLAQADPTTSAMAFGYYNAFAQAWNATAIADPMVRANTAVNAVAPSFIASLPDPQAQGMMQAVLASFNITNFSDPALAHAFTLNMVGSAAKITDLAFLQQVYDLGPSYSLPVVHSFTKDIITNQTLATYPIAMPEQLVTNFVSSNGETMLFMATFSVAADFAEDNGDKPLLDDVNVIRAMIQDLKASTGADITTYVTGDAAISADMEASSTNDMSMIEPITIIIIVVLMGVLFRSLLGQFLPLGAVGVAIGISQALVFVIGSTIAQINYTVLTMLFAVLMGVGTDYSIFIMTRYREERIKGAGREQAVHTSITWAGESIVTSGATVIIAFMAMSLSSLSFVQTMGLLLGMAIIVALLVSLTLVPAIIMLIGNGLFWPNTGKRFDDFAKKMMAKKAAGNHGYFHQAATFATKHAKMVILVSILVSIPTTYMYFTAETSFDFIGSMGSSESTDGMNAMADDFGAGKIMPTQVVITGDTVVYDGTTFNVAYLDAIDNLTATIAADSMVQQVSGVTRPYGKWVDYNNLTAMPAESAAAVQAAMLQHVGSDGRSVLLTVVLKDEPQKASAVDYVFNLRTEMAETKATLPALASSTIYVGGSTAMMADVNKDVSAQFTNIQILVMVGIFIVLMIVLGSLLLPLFAIVSIAMSITWAFAATYLLFGVLMGMPILWIIPLILFVMLMGIGMDYNVFILTRIKEEVHKGKEIREAVVDAVDWTGGIITALALIMAGAFGSIMLSSNTMLQMFGFALAVAVLLDAMVVRTYIVPAAIVLMGKWAWWAPGRLQRVGRVDKAKRTTTSTDESSE